MRSYTSVQVPAFIILTCMLWVWGGCLYQLNAQQPALGFSRDMLSPLEYQLNQRIHQQHSNIQPAAFGLEQSFYELADSSYASKISSNQVAVSGFGSLKGGFQMFDESKALGEVLVGLQLGMSFQNKFSVMAGYAMDAMSPPQYIQRMAEQRIHPGVGYAVSDKNGLFHTHYTYGHIAYNQGKFFQFELGKGKHFWGDGYRSLILSDNAAPYPYARITTKVWRLKYTNLWAQMRDRSFGQLLHQARIKYTASHALSWNIGRRFNVALYEMVVWQDRDTMSHRTLDIHYLNPIIFYRPVEYSVGSPDNVIIGLSFRIKADDNIQLYGQFVLDEFYMEQIQARNRWWANKYGGQLGIKVFNLGVPGLSAQAEYNIVRPFTYTHGSPVQSWSHHNQPLAHPLGANFGEFVTFLRYQHERWKFCEEFIWATYGRDMDLDGDGIIDNMGGNILRSYKAPFRTHGNVMYQGLRSVMHYHAFTVTRRLKNPDLEIFATHALRYEKNAQMKSLDHFLLVGIQTTGLLQPQRDY